MRTRDTTVHSWNDLVRRLYEIPKTSYGRYRSNFVYRGLADKRWGLETSLVRLGGKYEQLERALLRSFRKYAQPGSLLSDSMWMHLAIAQHHGLPTRLMDWTVSQRVAVHFATAEAEHYDKDGVIWCVDVTHARERLPESLRAVLYREYAFLFSIEMLQRSVPSLDDFEKFRSDGDFVVFFEPPSLDARIVNQGAIMSVMPRATSVVSKWLRTHADLYRRIIIPRKLKWEVRDKLDQDNVNERMLFPGLDGLSTWLKRYYGRGPVPARVTKVQR